jgi:hypothetical protein
MSKRSGNADKSGSASRVGAMRRIMAGLPSAFADLVTAALCIVAWWAPHTLPDDLLRGTALIMLIEFLSIHGLIMIPLLAVLIPGRWPYVSLALVMLLYFGIAAGASVALDTWWPTLFFAWLLLSRYVLPRWNIGGEDEHLGMGQLWVISSLLWIVLSLATVLLPIPSLGWDAATIAALGLPVKGIWADEPQRLLAFASIYFLLLAAYRLGAAPETAEQRDRHVRSRGKRTRRGAVKKP